MSNLQVSLFKNKKDNQPVIRDVAWPGYFLETRANDGKPKSERYPDARDIPLFSPALFAGTRSNSNVFAVTALVLDIDHTQSTLAAVLTAWKGYEVVFYTTRSHMEAEQSYRVVVPYTRPATPEEQVNTWYVANAKMGTEAVVLDKQCKDIGRMYYVASFHPNHEAAADSGYIPGSRLNPAAAPPAPLTEAAVKRATGETARIADAADFDSVTTDKRGSSALGKAVASLLSAPVGKRFETTNRVCYTLGGMTAAGHLSVKDFEDACSAIIDGMGDDRWDKAVLAYEQGLSAPMPDNDTSARTYERATPTCFKVR